MKLNFNGNKFHVVEVIDDKKEIRVTADFNFLADAEAAKLRMEKRGGNFAVRETA